VGRPLLDPSGRWLRLSRLSPTGGSTSVASYALKASEEALWLGSHVILILPTEESTYLADGNENGIVKAEASMSKAVSFDGIDVVRLGPTVTRTTHRLPAIMQPEILSGDGTNFCFGNRDGVVFDSVNRHCPRALARSAAVRRGAWPGLQQVGGRWPSRTAPSR